MIDGVMSVEGEYDNYRGWIRPLPPPLDIGKSSLHYGECVDSFYRDAWWEGVIFDHEDSSENRRIFFPDMDDEMTVCVNTLRITRDWDGVTEEWKPHASHEPTNEELKKLCDCDGRSRPATPGCSNQLCFVRRATDQLCFAQDRDSETCSATATADQRAPRPATVSSPLLRCLLL
nr:increased DNA methylation 1 [Ipomoea batatas]